MQSHRLTHDGFVWVFTMDDGENQIGASMLDQWTTVLDRVEQESGPRALVVTGSTRFWSTGLDLDEFAGNSESERIGFMNRFDRILGRILTAPFVTVAALNGHTIAGGALLALAHDYRIMAPNRGFMSLPSIDVGIAFTPGMSALISAKVPQPAAHDLVVSCRQIGGDEALSLGVVNQVAEPASVVQRSIDLAASMADKDPSALRTVKRRLYPTAAAMLTTGP